MIELTIPVRVVLAVIGLALVLTGLCRARLMSQATTVSMIRYAVTVQAGSGFLLVLCATVRPDWATAALLAVPSAALLAQAATARYWTAGLPAQFRLHRLPELERSMLRRVAGGSDN